MIEEYLTIRHHHSGCVKRIGVLNKHEQTSSETVVAYTKERPRAWHCSKLEQTQSDSLERGLIEHTGT